MNRPPRLSDQWASQPPELAPCSHPLFALPYVLAGAILLFVLAGFWRGLSLRPHSPEHRPNLRPFWWRNW